HTRGGRASGRTASQRGGALGGGAAEPGAAAPVDRDVHGEKIRDRGQGGFRLSQAWILAFFR
ncbi:hypothetical protein ABB34_04810, partial [Stenotrophomonas daejeonensis]